MQSLTGRQLVNLQKLDDMDANLINSANRLCESTAAIRHPRQSMLSSHLQSRYLPPQAVNIELVASIFLSRSAPFLLQRRLKSLHLQLSAAW